MKVAVTGGAGFIGSNIIKKLVKNHDVLSLDKNPVSNQNKIDGADYLKCDITDSESVLEKTKGTDVIFHLAALRSIKDSMENPLAYNKANIDGTVNVLEAARKNGCGQVVFTSTSSVYGNSYELPQKENSALKPFNIYGLTKLAGEHYCSIYSETFSLKTIAFRPFNVYGPRQEINAGVIPAFINSAITGKEVPFYGSGEQKRDFVYVKDLSDCYIMAMNSELAGGLSINIGSGKNYSIKEILEKVEKISGKKVNMKNAGSLIGDVKETLADISIAKKSLGWEPKYSLEKGLKETFEWYSNNSNF